jgi:hypothetical protein
MDTIEGEDREPTQQEGLMTSPEVIFDEKRSFGVIVETKISPELLGDMEDMLADLDGVNKALASENAGPSKARKTIEATKEADNNWQSIIVGNREEGESEPDIEIKDRMRRVIFGVSGIIERRIQREYINERYSAADSSERLEIEKRTNELNVEDVKWQQDIIILTLSMSRNPQGREILSKFWDSFESLHHGLDPRVTSSRSELSVGQQEARNLHNAVIGAVGTMILLNRKGYDPYLPDAHQDAEGKVDLWVKPKKAEWTEGFLGLQLKTSINGVRGLEARDIDSDFLDRMKRDPEKRKDATAARKLYDFLQKYGETFHAPSSGIWVDLTGTREEEVVDSITGEPHFDDFILNKQLDDFCIVLNTHFSEKRLEEAA